MELNILGETIAKGWLICYAAVPGEAHMVEKFQTLNSISVYIVDAKD